MDKQNLIKRLEIASNDPYITKLEKLSKDFEKNKNKMSRYQLIELVNLVIRGAISREKAHQDADKLAQTLLGRLKGETIDSLWDSASIERIQTQEWLWDVRYKKGGFGDLYGNDDPYSVMIQSMEFPDVITFETFKNWAGVSEYKEKHFNGSDK
ncbi:hypothetical protein [Enterococcus sp. DIV0240a]|uniref:hypothetical protein n=1 Tax=Enterococcus sp. DIV0240a TaxID=2774651 RepID=UPI003D2C5873